MIQVCVTFSCLSFDLSPHFRKPVAIVRQIRTDRLRVSRLSLNSRVNFMRERKCEMRAVRGRCCLQLNILKEFTCRFSFTELLARERIDRAPCRIARSDTRAHVHVQLRAPTRARRALM